MAYSSDGEGLHRHVDPADGRTYLYAMSFLDAAPRWFACFDQPDLKARYTFDVRAPEDWTVLGNGPATLVGRPGSWRITPRTRCRPTSRRSSPARTRRSAASTTASRSACTSARRSRAELEAQAPDMLAVTAASFDYYHRLFGTRYPFGEYHQAFVPDFNAGAMENPGCVTFRDGYVPRGRVTRTERGRRAGTIAHEMAHQWFGDLVTMRWWDDLWLNESFAEYLAHRCCTDATAVRAVARVRHHPQGLGLGRRPVALDPPGGRQRRAGRRRGAAELRRHLLRQGRRRCCASSRPTSATRCSSAGCATTSTRHAYGNATFADLLEAWTRAGAQDLPSLGGRLAAARRAWTPSTSSTPTPASGSWPSAPAGRAGVAAAHGPGRPGRRGRRV